MHPKTERLIRFLRAATDQDAHLEVGEDEELISFLTWLDAQREEHSETLKNCLAFKQAYEESRVPIHPGETVPKDGRFIMLLTDFDGGIHWHYVYYDDDNPEFPWKPVSGEGSSLRAGAEVGWFPIPSLKGRIK